MGDFACVAELTSRDYNCAIKHRHHQNRRRRHRRRHACKKKQDFFPLFGRRPAHASCSASVRCSSLHLLHRFALRLRRSGPRCPLVRLRGGSAPSATADGTPPIVVPPIATEPKPIPGGSVMPAESRGIVGGGRIGANGHGPWMRGIGSAARGGGGIGSAARGGGIGSRERCARRCGTTGHLERRTWGRIR